MVGIRIVFAIVFEIVRPGCITYRDWLSHSEFQRQCEENFELSQIYEAQLQENTNENNESMMYDQEQPGDEMEQD